MPTAKQKAAAKKISEDIRKPLGKSLRAVGYSKSISETPKAVIKSKGFQIAQRDILKELEDEEAAVLEAMKKKRKQASYGTLSMSRKAIREQAWEAEDRLKAGGLPPEKIEMEITIK